jgi:hypothetical protein
MLLMSRAVEARITECIFIVASVGSPRDPNQCQRAGYEHRSCALQAGQTGSITILPHAMFDPGLLRSPARPWISLIQLEGVIIEAARGERDLKRLRDAAFGAPNGLAFHAVDFVSVSLESNEAGALEVKCESALK